MILPRRKFLIGAAASLLAAPAIVRVGSLMPVKALPAVPTMERYCYPWKLLHAGIAFSVQELLQNGIVTMEVGGG